MNTRPCVWISAIQLSSSPSPALELRCIDPSTPWRRWWRKVLRGAVILLCQNIYIILYICIIWLVAWNMNFIFPCIGNVIIPTDELICFRGVGIPPTRNYHHTTMAFRHVIISYYIIEYHRHSHRWIFRCHEATRDLPRAAHHGVPLWGWGQGFHSHGATPIVGWFNGQSQSTVTKMDDLGVLYPHFRKTSI